MLDISLGEISIIGLIALTVLGPKEMFKIYKSLKKALSEIKDSIEKQLKFLDEQEGDEDLMDVTIDDDGIVQKTYKLDKIMEKIKHHDDSCTR